VTDSRPPKTTEILGIACFKFQDGGFDAFERLSRQAMKVVKAQDTGTYDVFCNADRTGAIVIERHRDSDYPVRTFRLPISLSERRP